MFTIHLLFECGRRVFSWPTATQVVHQMCCGQSTRGFQALGHSLAGKISFFGRIPGITTILSGFGNEPRDSLEGNHRGWFAVVVPSFPAENRRMVLRTKAFEPAKQSFISLRAGRRKAPPLKDAFLRRHRTRSARRSVRCKVLGLLINKIGQAPGAQRIRLVETLSDYFFPHLFVSHDAHQMHPCELCVCLSFWQVGMWTDQWLSLALRSNGPAALMTFSQTFVSNPRACSSLVIRVILDSAEAIRSSTRRREISALNSSWLHANEHVFLVFGLV